MNATDHGYYLRLARIIALTLLGVILVSTASCAVTDYNIRMAISAGADPVQAACAIAPTSFWDSSVCMAAELKPTTSKEKAP